MKNLVVCILLTLALPTIAQGTSNVRDCKVENTKIAVRVEISSYDGKQQVHIIRKSDVVAVRYIEKLGEYCVEIDTRGSAGNAHTFKFSAANAKLARETFDQISSLTLLTKGKQE